MRIACLAFLAAGLGSCAGGGGGIPPLAVVLFNFSPGFGGVHLNSPLELRFSAPVDANTVTADSIRIFTTTTTTEQPDPGAPAIGDYEITGEVVIFRPRIPRRADLQDAGLRIGFTYAIEVPASPDVIEPVRTIEGDPNVVAFIEFFTTLNSTILPAPADIPAEPNLPQLHRFFIDEFDYTNSLGVDGCDRLQRNAAGQPILDSFGNPLPAFPGALDAPQVVDSDPAEGESGFGTITGIVQGLGTAFVRLDPITLLFSEPISPWRIRAQNISIRNVNLGGETFDLFMFFTQDRNEVKLQITVFDADSAFDQASVPQGRYVLTLTQFTDLAGNPLVNPKGTSGCEASGTFELSFSTVSSPSLPTDFKLTFGDDTNDGYVDYGGLDTASHDANLLPQHVAPFLGGMATDLVMTPSPSNQSSGANWGDTAFWTGVEVRYDNGYDPNDPTRQIPQALRLRGGSNTAATPILCPLAGRGTGPSDIAGSTAGSEADATETGKLNFLVGGFGDADARPVQDVELFTGNASTGPIVYHYNRFRLREDASGTKPRLSARKTGTTDSLYPLIILVEDVAEISGIVDVDGQDGDWGYNGPNDGTGLSKYGRNPGGLGGLPGPGGGPGGDGGSSALGSDPTPGPVGDPEGLTGNNELLDGQNGWVPYNAIGPLDQLSESVAGLASMSTGGGGRYHDPQPKDTDGDGTVDVVPNFQGGGGGGTQSAGTNGGDFSTTTPGGDHGRGGQQVGTLSGMFTEAGILCSGGAGGGGGAADDDGGGDGSLEDRVAGPHDDGGGGGGGGGGFFGIACRGDIVLGFVDDNGTPDAPDDDIPHPAILRCVGGHGGATYIEDVIAGLGTFVTSVDAVAAGGAAGFSKFTRASGDWTTDGFVAGQLVETTGFTTAANNGQWRVSSVSTTDLVVEDSSDVITDESAAAANQVTIILDIFGDMGEGEAGGGGGGGGIVAIAGNDLIVNAVTIFAYGKVGGNSPFVEDGNRTTADAGGAGGGGKIYLADRNGFASSEVFGNPFVTLQPDPGSATTLEEFLDLNAMSGTAFITLDVWGDDPRETMFGPTQIVTECFDTLSDSTSYDGALILWNAPRFPYSAGNPASRTMRIFMDTVKAGAGGLPNIAAVEAADGSFQLDPGIGATEEIPDDDPGVMVDYQMTPILDPGVGTLGKRFVRVRIIFDPTLISTDPDVLLSGDGGSYPGFDVGGVAPLPIADDPATPDLENTQGNLDTAPAGVPAIAELRIRFTP